MFNTEIIFYTAFTVNKYVDIIQHFAENSITTV